MRLASGAALGTMLALVFASCGGDRADAGGARVYLAVARGTPRAVVYDGLRDGVCAQNAAFAGDGPVVIGEGRWQAGCPSERIVAFAAGWAPRLVRDAWIPQGAIYLQPLFRVPVRFWVVANSSEQKEAARALLREHVADASRVLAELGAGVRLEYDPEADITDVGYTGQGGAAKVNGVELGCGSVDQLESSGQGDTPAPYGGRDRLSVYYVPWEYIEGVVCGGAFGHPEVVFVSYVTRRTPSTLVHEIGHALGPSSWVHVDLLDGFRGRSSGNLMNGGVREVREITLGQSFRLQFDGSAWGYRLFEEQRAGWPSLACASSPCRCQDSRFTNDPCLPLAVRPAKNWP